MTEFIITTAIVALVSAFVWKKVIAVVCEKAGWDNPFVGVRELMRQGHSFPEAIALSTRKRMQFELKVFLRAAAKVLPFGRGGYVSEEQAEADRAYWDALMREANREAEAQKMVDAYGGKISDYL